MLDPALQNKAQEDFNKVVAYAQTMTRRSKNIDQVACLYRSSGGNRCFIGHLIEDKYYSPLFDSFQLTFDRLIAKVPNLKPYLKDNNGPYFLRELQQIHDRHCLDYDPNCSKCYVSYAAKDSDIISMWPDRFEAFASRWGLKFDKSTYKQVPLDAD